MLNIRFRNQTNTWPAFVDLFSNLVIILIFLLIVFVFLWTTTSVFNQKTGLATVAELKKANEEQSQTIAQMAADEAEATQLLVMARTELVNLESDRDELIAAVEVLDSELMNADMTLEELNAAYEAQIAQTTQYQAQIDELAKQIEQTKSDSAAQNAALTAQMNAELAKLNAALAAAEAKSAEQETQYIQMSERLNKALADKVAELNQVGQFQSDFYRAIKLALGDRTTIQQDGDRFIVNSDILFKSGAYQLSTEGREQLRLISNVIKDLEEKIPTNIDWIIRVDGHTDNKAVVRGTRGYSNNTQLSLLRATAVSNELAKNGVSRRRLLPAGFGSLHPVELGSDAESLQKNRRIELQLTNR